jgi:hypothetical protein
MSATSDVNGAASPKFVVGGNPPPKRGFPPSSRLSEVRPSRPEEHEVPGAPKHSIMGLLQAEQLVGVSRDDFVKGGFDGFQSKGFVAVVRSYPSAAAPHGRIQQ